jgi:hypothetical protein
VPVAGAASPDRLQHLIRAGQGFLPGAYFVTGTMGLNSMAVECASFPWIRM